MPPPIFAPRSNTSTSTANANATANPPPLPPSVEKNYRKKCIELKRRMLEVDESNDAYRLRKIRLNRGIMKLRLERAFLLEQLAKRTSQNVEDSEGSPSPPPTPKEKPLRIKRGHRRPEPAANPDLNQGELSASSPQNLAASPAGAGSLATQVPIKRGPGRPSNATLAAAAAARRAALAGSSPATNGRRSSTPAIGSAGPPPRRPETAYLIYCAATREDIIRQNGPDFPEGQVEKALAQAWRDLGKEGQAPYVAMYNERREGFEKERKAYHERKDNRGSVGASLPADEQSGRDVGGLDALGQAAEEAARAQRERERRRRERESREQLQGVHDEENDRAYQDEKWAREREEDERLSRDAFAKQHVAASDEDTDDGGVDPSRRSPVGLGNGTGRGNGVGGSEDVSMNDVVGGEGEGLDEEDDE